MRASDTSFQVKWTASAHERGSLAGTSRWTAILTIALRPPHSAEILRKNPLGLYVEAIDWSREIDAQPGRTAAAAQPKPASPSTSDGIAEREPSEIFSASFLSTCQKVFPMMHPNYLAFLLGTIVLTAPVLANEAAPPSSRVTAANRAASKEPAATGFFHAIHVYPYADGTFTGFSPRPGG